MPRNVLRGLVNAPDCIVNELVAVADSNRDLKVMSLASYRSVPPRDEKEAKECSGSGVLTTVCHPALS